jgi:fatty-acyl-CoA synthase
MREYIVHEIIRRTLITNPDQLVVSGSTRLTYSQMYGRVLRLANSMKRLGIGPGVTVGVLDANTHRFLELHYALSMLGAVLHTINFRLSPEHMVYSMVHAGDEWIFASDTFMGAVKPLTQKFPNWVVMSDDPDYPLPESSTAYRYEDLVADGEERELPEADRIKDTDIFSIFYTTGTTGSPKGMRYQHKQILLGALQLFHHMSMHITGARVDSRDVFMPLVPFFHIHAWGMAFFPPYLGSKLVLGGAANPEAQAKIIRSEGVTMLNMVPTQLHMLLEQPGFGNVKVLTGGSPLPSGLASRAAEAGVKFSLIYGGSDQLGTAISVVPEDVDPNTPEALEWLRVGMRPFPMVEVSIRDEDGYEVPHDGKTVGAVWVRSPWLPDGYYKEPDLSAQTYIEGWFRSGDLGFFYPNGGLYVADRERDAIKSGGEWIPTGILESLLSEAPGVGIVAVIAREDERWGERPLGIVKPVGAVTAEDLRAFLETKVAEGTIAKHWIPDSFEFVDEIPLTSAGKINKVVLRERFAK